jgi:hypothetical protein
MGNNIGMNIMKERASRIGAHIDIESEVDRSRLILASNIMYDLLSFFLCVNNWLLWILKVHKSPFF